MSCSLRSTRFLKNSPGHFRRHVGCNRSNAVPYLFSCPGSASHVDGQSLVGSPENPAGTQLVTDWDTDQVRNTLTDRITSVTRWSGDVIRRTVMKNFNAVSHNRARPYFRIQHGRGEVRARRVYLNVHSVTGNVVDTEWSVEFWRWKCCREFGNNT